ncbi:hypothetical protein ACH5RR_036378 [Cinchona calisaya]|uniref:Uncharacterized protein n=1 Tax=Cinchona calisaya TaxID=153742 RepID=A0ABD2Y320_9GENT
MSETKITDTSIHDSDPLVLHRFDHPGVMFVSKPLEGYNYGGTPKRLLKCSHCDREGYLITHSFYLHGFLVGHKLHGKNVKPKGKRPTAHNTQTNDVEPPKAPTTAAATFTTKEYNRLMALLRKGNGNEQYFANITGTLAPTCNFTQHI